MYTLDFCGKHGQPIDHMIMNHPTLESGLPVVPARRGLRGMGAEVRRRRSPGLSAVREPISRATA